MSGIFGRQGQRLAAFAAAALFLWYMGIEVSSPLPWALLIMVVILEFLAYQHGVVEGVIMYRSLTPSQKQELDKLIDEEAGNEN